MPPRPSSTKSGRDTYDKETRKSGVVTAPRPREQITQDNSLEENHHDTLNKLENEDNPDKIKEIKQETKAGLEINARQLQTQRLRL